MEMDFRSLKRRDLQKLCKKHGLRANSTNSQMVDSLVSLFQILEKNKPIKGCLKGSCGSSGSEGEIVQRIPKKVTFILNEEKESGAVLCIRDENCSSHRRSSRRLSKLRELKKGHDETQVVGVVKNPTEGCAVPVRTIRSRSRISGVMCSPVREKKKARRCREVTRKNAEVLSDTGTGEDGTIGTRKEALSEMIPIWTLRNDVVVAGEAKANRKQNSGNSSVEFNNESLVSFPVEDFKTIDLVSEEENSCARTLTTKSLREVTKIIDLVDEEEIFSIRPLATKSLREVSEAIDLVCEEENSSASLLATKPPCRVGAVSFNVEEVWDTSAGERTVEKSSNAQISLTIDRHDDHKLCYLVECDSEVIGWENSDVVVQKKDKDLETLATGSDRALEESTSIQLEDLNELPKTIGNAVMTWEDVGLLCDKFQKKTSDNDVEEANTAAANICTNSSDGHKDLELQQLSFFGNSEVARNIWTEEENGKCNSQLCNSYMIDCVEADQESKASPSSEREKNKPQNLIVSSIIEDSATVVGNHFGCIEFDEKDASSTKEICYSNGCALSPDLKKLSECKAHLDANENEDGNFLKKKQDCEEVAEDSNVEENRSYLCPQSYESSEGKNGINLLGYDENISEKPSDSIIVEAEPGGLFVTDESGILLEENGSYLCLQSYQSSDKKNRINFLGYDENIKKISESIQKFPGSIRLEAEPGDFFATNESVILLEELSRIKGGESFAFKDNVHENQDNFKHVGEKLCSTVESQVVGSVKVLEIEKHASNLLEKMEEIAPFELDKRFDNIMERLLSLKKVLQGEIDPSGIALSHSRESHSTSKNEMSSEKPYIAHKQETQILTTLMLADSVHENYELNGSEANITEKVEEITIKSSLNDAYSKECLVIDQEASAKSIEVLEKIKLDSTSIELECERNSGSSCFLEKSKLSNIINNSPAEDDKHAGIPCLSETQDGHSSLSIKHANAKHPVGLLAMESNDCSLLRTVSLDYDVPSERNDIVEECDLIYIKPAEGDPWQDKDLDVKEYLEIAQCASVKSKEVLQKIKFVSPFKENRIDLEIEDSFIVTGFEKSKLNNSMNNSSTKEDKHVGIPCLSETLDGCSLSVEQANAKHPICLLASESHDYSLLRIDKLAHAIPLERKSPFSSYNAGPVEECDLSYIISVGGEPCEGGNLDAQEYLEIDQCASAKSKEVMQKIKLVSPSKKSSGACCISKKNKLSSGMANSPTKDIKRCLFETLHDHSSPLINQANAEHLLDPLTMESEDSSLSRIDAVPSECKVCFVAPFGDSTGDPIEEITRKLINFTISSTQKATKTDILSTPTKPAVNFKFYTSVSGVRGKENTPSTKMNYSSNCKMRSAVSTKRRPLQSVTNQMHD